MVMRRGAEAVGVYCGANERVGCFFNDLCLVLMPDDKPYPRINTYREMTKETGKPLIDRFGPTRIG